MTFSDRRVVELVRARMVPVWETAAPVQVAVFDLGDGKVVKGTVGGEIAIYFCRPDGRVFDILPALQSPKRTLEAIREALAFYDRTGATDAAIRAHHGTKLLAMNLAAAGYVTPKAAASRARLGRRMADPDGGTRAISEMTLSKTAVFDPAEPIVVVEPGGYAQYKRAIHERFARQPVARTPAEWKREIFEDVLGQRLDRPGGEIVYDPDSLEPMSLLPE